MATTVAQAQERSEAAAAAATAAKQAALAELAAAKQAGTAAQDAMRKRANEAVTEAEARAGKQIEAALEAAKTATARAESAEAAAAAAACKTAAEETAKGATSSANLAAQAEAARLEAARLKDKVVSLEGALSSERESLGTMRTKLAAAKSAMESRVAAMQQELTLAKEGAAAREAAAVAAALEERQLAEVADGSAHAERQIAATAEIERLHKEVERLRAELAERQEKMGRLHVSAKAALERQKAAMLEKHAACEARLSPVQSRRSFDVRDRHAAVVQRIRSEQPAAAAAALRSEAIGGATPPAAARVAPSTAPADGSADDGFGAFRGHDGGDTRTTAAVQNGAAAVLPATPGSEARAAEVASRMRAEVAALRGQLRAAEAKATEAEAELDADREAMRAQMSLLAAAEERRDAAAQAAAAQRDAEAAAILADDRRRLEEAAAAARSHADAALKEATDAAGADARRLRAELSAVRARARALVEEKDLENEKLRAQRHKLQPLPNALDLLDGSARPGTLSRSSSHSSTATATAAPGAAADEQILLSTARAQAGRDAEMARLAQKASDATRKAEEKAAAASRERTRADGLARDLRLAQSAAVPGYIKEVVLKYLLAGDAAAADAILPVLSSVLQFSTAEAEQLRASRATVVDDAASYISTLFGAAPVEAQKPPLPPRPLPAPSEADSVASETEAELRRKVARLKRLLAGANLHLARLAE
uniref:GRIP domain-containing protein n=1 Tax=Emiliania huxleyi TaxID=2903 RepID=A0A7S3X218_EMIHU